MAQVPPPWNPPDWLFRLVIILVCALPSAPQP
jgi:hypothetical protein